MRVLKSNYHLFETLSICPAATNTALVRLKNIAILMTHSIVVVSTLIASFLYVKRNIKKDFENALTAVFNLSILVAAVYIMIIGFALRHDIKNVFAAFQKTYDDCMKKIRNPFSRFMN